MQLAPMRSRLGAAFRVIEAHSEEGVRRIVGDAIASGNPR
jgi:hypothetical protein